MGALVSFLPYHLASALADRTPTRLDGWFERSGHIVLFADIKGFTPLSEDLGRQGQAGNEQLTGLLNRYFARMIELSATYGGSLAAFGGDAMTIVFPYDRDSDLEEAAARALACALAMQAAMPAYTRIATLAGVFDLAIKIGIAAGEVLTAVVGDPENRLQSLIAGLPLVQAADAERHSGIGEILLHHDLARHVSGLRVGRPRDAYLPVIGLDQTPQTAPLPPLPALPPDMPIQAFVHPAIADRLRAISDSFLNERRSVTVLFVGFAAVDDASPEYVARIQAYVVAVLRVVQRYGGELNKIDMGDKGNTLMVVFGAPVAHEDDPELAMHCALELARLQVVQHDGTIEVPARIGIASGLAYCGLVGSDWRVEYTVIGDTPNLAARLMQAARPGEVFVAAGSRRRVADRFIWDAPMLLPVRGWSRPVTTYRLERSRPRSSRYQAQAYRLPMVGREEEIHALEGWLYLATQGQGHVVGLQAEAGMGKSRLIAELTRNALRQGVSVLSGECISHGASISYLPWHSILRDLFEIDPTAAPRQQRQQLHDRLAVIDPQIVGRLPILEIALNMQLGETELTRSLDARVRKDVIETTIVECVRAIAADAGPLLMVIEDAHWIDPLSYDLLVVLSRVVAELPLVIVLAYRPLEQTSSHLRLDRLDAFSEIMLHEFTLRESEWLIGLKFGYLFGAREVLSPAFVERITARSQGNPFYIDQIVNYIQDQGVSPYDTAALERVQLPDSLRALIVSRIDRLDERQRIVLKVASVLGRVFRASWLWGIYPQLGQPDQVKAHLDTLSRLDLTPMERTEPELEYLFKHVMTQEVAYESMASTTRLMLHEQVGRFIEAHFADDLERYLDTLAYHYGHSKNIEKQRHYYRLAGEAAQAAYSNQIALDYYTHLMQCLDGVSQVEVLLRIGDVLQLIGQWEEAHSHFDRARGLAAHHGDARLIARCDTAVAVLDAARGANGRTVAILENAINVFELHADWIGLYDALTVLGNLEVDQGRYTRGLRCFEHAHEIAVQLDDRRRLARAIGSMGLVYVDVGDYEMALYCLERSAQTATAQGDWGLLCRSMGSVGFIYMNQDRLSEAWEIFESLLRRAVEIGDRRLIARMARELGRVLTLAGDVERGLHCYAATLAIDLELGERRDVSVALGYIAHAYAYAGMIDQAQSTYDLAIGWCDAIGLVYWGSEFRHALAHLRVRQQRYAEAAELNQTALDTTRRLQSHKLLQLNATLLDTRLQVLQGAQSPASAIALLTTLDDEWYTDREHAAIDYAIWRIDPARDDVREQALQRYNALIDQQATAENCRRIDALGGAHHDPLVLPPLPTVLAQREDDLATLIMRLEQTAVLA
jgi:adenylate cyclase